MRIEQREKLIEAMLQYPECDDELLAELEDIVRSDMRKLEPTLDAMLTQARLDGAFESLLMQAAAAQRNEVCKNCGVRSIAVPF